MFSRRVPATLARNRLAAAVERTRESGRPLIDLTISNPTAAGLQAAGDVAALLSDPAVLDYRPEPFGLPSARAAVAHDARRLGIDVDSGAIVLTASTSEAYSLLFKLLCDPGDDVLVPRPGYPLFDHLARFEAIEAVPYELHWDGVWSIDTVSFDAALGPRTRAIVIVSPNNPTGSFLRAHDWERVHAIARERGLAVIVDEVFGDYAVAPAGDAVRSVLAHGKSEALVFALGGLSKSAGLPQMKVGWTMIAGAEPMLSSALARLELLCDMYLSVSTPVQVALPRLIDEGRSVRQRIVERVLSNYQQLQHAVTAEPACRVLDVEGGWSAVVRVPATRSEEELVVSLVTEAGVLVHPGYFFDFPHEAFIVLSLLAEPADFDRGVSLMLTHVGRS